MVNTAEKVHRIRRRREYLQEVGHYQPGGLEDILVKLKAAGISADEVVLRPLSEAWENRTVYNPKLNHIAHVLAT